MKKVVGMAIALTCTAFLHGEPTSEIPASTPPPQATFSPAEVAAIVQLMKRPAAPAAAWGLFTYLQLSLPLYTVYLWWVDNEPQTPPVAQKKFLLAAFLPVPQQISEGVAALATVYTTVDRAVVPCAYALLAYDACAPADFFKPPFIVKLCAAALLAYKTWSLGAAIADRKKEQKAKKELADVQHFQHINKKIDTIGKRVTTAHTTATETQVEVKQLKNYVQEGIKTVTTKLDFHTGELSKIDRAVCSLQALIGSINEAWERFEQEVHEHQREVSSNLKNLSLQNECTQEQIFCGNLMNEHRELLRTLSNDELLQTLNKTTLSESGKKYIIKTLSFSMKK